MGGIVHKTLFQVNKKVAKILEADTMRSMVM